MLVFREVAMAGGLAAAYFLWGELVAKSLSKSVSSQLALSRVEAFTSEADPSLSNRCRAESVAGIVSQRQIEFIPANDATGTRRKAENLYRSGS